MRFLVKMIDNDVELQALKKEFKLLTGKFAPPFNFDEYNGFEDYKEKMRQRVEKLREEKKSHEST